MKIGDVVSCRNNASKGTGTIVGLQQVFGEKYADVFFDKVKEKITLPVSELNSLLAPELKFEAKEFSSSQMFMLRLIKEQILATITQQGLRSAGNFKILPLPHQLLAVDFVLGQFKPRALIADEVGLGKTIEAALIYEELKARNIAKRILIVAPSGLCGQWQEEMKLKFSEDFALYDRDTVHSLKKLNGEMTNVWTLKNQIITSIDFIKPKKISEELSEYTLKRRQWHNRHIHEATAEAGFDVVIFDEAHKLTKDMSDEETARYKAGKKLADTTPILLLLSATPHQGDTSKFRNLLNLIDPYLFYKGCEMTPENVKKVTVRNNKRAAVDFNGNRLFKHRITSLYTIKRDAKDDEIEIKLYDAVTEYVSEYYDMASRDQDRTLMFLLLIYQRMVSSSSRAILKAFTKRMNALIDAKDKAEAARVEISSYNDLDADDIEELTSEEQVAILEKYEGLKGAARTNEYLRKEIDIIKRCTELARSASTGRNDTKFRKLLEVIDKFIVRENKPDLKFIIFTEFIETQNYIDDCLKGLGYKTALINGLKSSDEKVKARNKFQNEAQFLISTDAGGEGINLQFCWVMINYDMPWNPMRLEQRIGRIDRIGQQHDVKIINFQLADTVEQRVRDIIESKLETIKQEFNDGEDKLADILSTLQDEFSFEKIYIDAVRKRESSALQLNEIAENMYTRAKQIINSGDMVLPFSDLDTGSISKRELEKHSEMVKTLVTWYLRAHDSELEQYKTKENVYYFDDPLTQKQMKNIIFDQKISVEHEDYELFTFTNPYIVELMNRLDDMLVDVTTARIKVPEKKFAGEKGFLFNYILTITNNIDPPERYNIPIFIDIKNRHNNRISQYFSDASNIRTSELIAGKLDLNINETFATAHNTCDQKAESIFFEYKNEHDELIKEIENKMKKYFKDKEESINKIAVDNIRTARLNDLKNDIEKQRKDLQKKRAFVPSITCEQIAYLEFV
ncbi:MAG: SNF2-related protein [Candidatus Methanoperedenaceae archaeon]|nr:SNF2-related protein [Candidatus Methanoperedenaceae archaeon]